jgi:hypothetical protein
MEPSQNLDGEFWGLTTYFNPAGYANKLEHLRKFSASIRKQGLKLIVIEMAFGDRAYELDPSICDLLLQVRGSSIMWQKERLLNLASRHLPEACDKVVWVDGDIIFRNQHWVTQTCDQLRRFPIVQPFATAGWLRADAHSDSNKWTEQDCELIRPGVAYTQASQMLHNAPASASAPGHWGFAWAWRREILDRYGFYDRFILGGGDLAMTWAMYGQMLRRPDRELWLEDNCSLAQIRDYEKWRGPFTRAIEGRVAHTAGEIYHFWHGSLSDRKYSSRNLILKDADFDPQKDIYIDSQGCWRWLASKRTNQLEKAISSYFAERSEEAR